MQDEHVNVKPKFSISSIVSMAFPICFMHLIIRQNLQRGHRAMSPRMDIVVLGVTAQNFGSFESQISSESGGSQRRYFSTKLAGVRSRMSTKNGLGALNECLRHGRC